MKHMLKLSYMRSDGPSDDIQLQAHKSEVSDSGSEGFFSFISLLVNAEKQKS